jgi:hypothetical protein
MIQNFPFQVIVFSQWPNSSSHIDKNKTDTCLYTEKNKEGKTTYLGEMGFLSFSDTMSIWSAVERDIESQRQFKHVGRQRNVWFAGRSSKDLVGHFSERIRVYLSLYSDMAGVLSVLNPR